ncbi:hypothetical protein NA57DRAFT_73191 [Rhizodiscina lignyota]|uniref:Alpha/beta hydrolase fold-3 domain-containing protein n=1 Tax=Rhizodiscina lignyota TaxID=1504668 RepID=A0A9P4MDK9_9PEZI|nr:hypothetical protein NA57DRAFT_73191 [Rhizodiscina lignyota]
MASLYKYPKDTVRHHSGTLNHEGGLSKEWMKFEEQLGFRPAVNLDGTLVEQRKAFEDACALRDESSLTEDLREGVSVQDEEIKLISSGETSAIPIRIYKPTTAAFTRDTPNESELRPAAVFFHGGGWILGSIATDDLFCRQIAYDLGHVVVSVEYRLAPEYVYPAAIDDCYSGPLWTLENARPLGIDPSQVYVTGNSAGGHLAAAVALKSAEAETGFALAAQVLRIPATCHPQVFPGVLPRRQDVPVFNDSAASSMFDSFVPNKDDRTSPLVSPLLANPDHIRKLPPTYIDACSVDPLVDGGIAYAKKLEDNDVPVKLFILEGMPHGSFILFPELDSSKAARSACMQGTLWALGHTRSSS